MNIQFRYFVCFVVFVDCLRVYIDTQALARTRTGVNVCVLVLVYTVIPMFYIARCIHICIVIVSLSEYL